MALIVHVNVALPHCAIKKIQWIITLLGEAGRCKITVKFEAVRLRYTYELPSVVSR